MADPAMWARQETARAPPRFRQRVLGQFRSPQNIEYLRGLFAGAVPRGPLRRHILATLDDAVLEFSGYDGRAYDILSSDPTARRGDARRAVGLWAEVRRLNAAFFEDRRAFLREHAHTIDRRAPRDGVADDDEDYAMRMFTADSLRPPGLEHLNTPGPFFALREDQSTWIPRGSDLPLRRERFAGAPLHNEVAHDSVPLHNEVATLASGVPDSMTLDGEPAYPAAPAAAYSTYPQPPRRPPAPPASREDDRDGETDAAGDDEAWSAGNPNRTPEQAMAEYWGDDRVTSDTAIGAPETMGKAYGDIYAWGNNWQDNGGSRFMRRPEIPFWQQGGREGVDYDIEETLGTAARECDAHVRRWDLDKVRNPRGQEYRQLGPRSGGAI
jgi:hypothetical protein